MTPDPRLVPVHARMARAVAGGDDRTGALYGLMRYHLGWADDAGHPVERRAAIQPVGDLLEARESMRFEIRDTQGTTIWRQDLPADRLRELDRGSEGMAPFVVPSGTLPPGRYEMVQMSAGGTVLLRAPFTVSDRPADQRQSPAATKDAQ